MEAKAKRTLVKSAPELWELADDMERMERWMTGVAGSPGPVTITARVPGRLLAWRSTRLGGSGTRMAIELAEKGLGTAVSIEADPAPAGGGPALEQLLDELGSPERRPFTR